jgi:hypothetical protein
LIYFILFSNRNQQADRPNTHIFPKKTEIGGFSMDKTTPMDAVTAELLSLEVERLALVAQIFWMAGIAVVLFLVGAGGGVTMGNPLLGLILGGGLAVLLGGIWGGAILLPAQRAFVYRF